MTVIFKTKNFEADLGYMGFFRLRRKIEELISPELAELHAEYSFFLGKCQLNKEFYLHMLQCRGRYLKKKEEIYEKQENKKILDFFHISDCKDKIDSDTCKVLWNVIKDYDDDVLYGRYDKPFPFSAFKKLVRDGIESDEGIEIIWR